VSVTRVFDSDLLDRMCYFAEGQPIEGASVRNVCREYAGRTRWSMVRWREVFVDLSDGTFWQFFWNDHGGGGSSEELPGECTQVFPRQETRTVYSERSSSSFEESEWFAVFRSHCKKLES
jgi:hypothetical protein